MLKSERNQVIAWSEWQRYGSIMPACLVGMALVALHAYTVGVMIGPLEREFGWSRSQISAGPLVTSIATLLMAPIAGRALDRHGPRRIALIGIPAFAVAIALISTAGPSIISWLALYALLAVALMLIFPTVWTGAIAMRFEKNRGLAMAIALSGTGITSAVVPFLASRLIEEFGWRGAYIALGAMSFVVAFPLVLLLFGRDEEHRHPACSSSPSAVPTRGRSEYMSIATDQSPSAASVACFLLGLAAGAEYDTCAYLTTRHFPRRNFGALFGLIGALAGVGSGVSPMLANVIYDVTGTYETVLWGIVPLFALSGLLFLSIGKYPDQGSLHQS